jgi:hypothetical protein
MKRAARAGASLTAVGRVPVPPRAGADNTPGNSLTRETVIRHAARQKPQSESGM